MPETMKPMDIEKRSFEIITELLGDRVLAPENELVIKRVIHTTADFDYVENLRFSAHAVGKGIEALRGGCDIVTDTQMARAGVNKTILGKLGGEVRCFMSESRFCSKGCIGAGTAFDCCAAFSAFISPDTSTTRSRPESASRTSAARFS